MRDLRGVLLMFGLTFGAFACNRPLHAAADLPKPAIDLPAGKQGETRTAVFAGGCFWGTEGAFEQLAGVTNVVSGYAGDTKDKADYERVSSGATNHAESIQITYDPSKISYGELRASCSRSAIRLQRTIKAPITGTSIAPRFSTRTTTRSEWPRRTSSSSPTRSFSTDRSSRRSGPLGQFYPAEQYHQDYVKLHPDDPYIRQWYYPKVEKLRKHFAGELKILKK